MIDYRMKKKENHFLYLGIIVIIGYLYLQEKTKNNNINIYLTESDSSDEEFEEPKRYYDSKYHSRGRMDINVPTRGEPPEYQQVGILRGDDSDNIKPLYGRQTHRGSNQWNYFTSLDSHLATKVPVFVDANDCTDERGCKEIYKNDNVLFGEGGESYSASIYNTAAPRYIPYI